MKLTKKNIHHTVHFLLYQRGNILHCSTNFNTSQLRENRGNDGQNFYLRCLSDVTVAKLSKSPNSCRPLFVSTRESKLGRTSSTFSPTRLQVQYKINPYIIIETNIYIFTLYIPLTSGIHIHLNVLIAHVTGWDAIMPLHLRNRNKHIILNKSLH